jgi:hypothetical protein
VKYICSPKNGPVPGWRVNGYPEFGPVSRLTEKG